ncbi:P2Y purinoceptor 14-like isoform X2 [Pseudoliparis swirei]|uniref:P2Y purinoceptor 14-like isoform X2 n=1 Tax=Pseudoliparis swirei TaxID=2059687 RepID=UPI0024BD96FB|nr:P2Y purinoceptor 14-like isoform X2 [Pseudoliparis swirei]
MCVCVCMCVRPQQELVRFSASQQEVIFVSIGASHTHRSSGTMAASSGPNRTNGSGSSACDRVHGSAHVLLLLVYTLVFLAGLLLNGFTLKVYFCRAPRPAASSVTVYLKNLAAADFLVSLCLPMRITNYASGSASVRRVYCTFGASAFYLNMYASIAFMGYIAANRYLKIVRPRGTHFLETVRAAHVISGVTWVLLLATMAAYVALSLLTEEAPPLAEEAPPASALSCEVLHSRPLALFYKAVHCASAAVFLLVLVSLVFFYHAVSRRLALAQRQEPASSGSTKLAESRRNMRVLVGVFCVCFVPYHLVRLPYAFLRRRCWWSHALFYLKELTVMVSVLNVCLDPLIYFLFCKAFRAQMSPGRRLRPPRTAPQATAGERRSSDGWLRASRKTSLTTSTRCHPHSTEPRNL